MAALHCPWWLRWGRGLPRWLPSCFQVGNTMAQPSLAQDLSSRRRPMTAEPAPHHLRASSKGTSEANEGSETIWRHLQDWTSDWLLKQTTSLHSTNTCWACATCLALGIQCWLRQTESLCILVVQTSEWGGQTLYLTATGLQTPRMALKKKKA